MNRLYVELVTEQAGIIRRKARFKASCGILDKVLLTLNLHKVKGLDETVYLQSPAKPESYEA